MTKMKTCFNCGESFEGSGDICGRCQRELAKPKMTEGFVPVERWVLISARIMVTITALVFFAPFFYWITGLLA